MDVLSPEPKARKPLGEVNADAADKIIRMMDFASKKKNEKESKDRKGSEFEEKETPVDREDSTEANQEDELAPTFADASPFEDQADSPYMPTDGQEMKTPTAGRVSNGPAPIQSHGSMDGPREAALKQEIVDLVSWKRPEKTGLVFGVGFLLLLSQPLRMFSFSPVSAGSYILLAILGYNSIKTFMYPSDMPKEFRIGFETFRGIIERISPLINVTMSLLADLLSGQDEKRTLKLASLLWLGTSIGNYMSTNTFLTLSWVIAFALPSLMNQDIVREQISSWTDIVLNEASTRYSALGLTWKHKLAVGTFVYFLIARLCSYTTFMFAVFVMLNIVKLNLQPIEAEKVRVRARRVQEIAWQLATPVSHFKKRL